MLCRSPVRTGLVLRADAHLRASDRVSHRACNLPVGTGNLGEALVSVRLVTRATGRPETCHDIIHLCQIRLACGEKALQRGCDIACVCHADPQIGGAEYDVFVIGEGATPMISLPKRKGIKKTILEERADRPPKA